MVHHQDDIPVEVSVWDALKFLGIIAVGAGLGWLAAANCLFHTC